jgi:hypothetical protein
MMMEIYDALKSESVSPGTFREAQGAPIPKKVATTGGKREGAGRPRRNGNAGDLLDTPQVVYLTTGQKKRIKQRAAFEGLSVSELLRQIIERYLL